MSILKYLVLFISFALVGCGSYNKYKEKKELVYLASEETKPLVYPVGVAGIEPSSRYNIPTVMQDNIVDTVEPPDYRS